MAQRFFHTGWHYPSTVVSTNVPSIGTQSWSSPTNAQGTRDGVVANTTVSNSTSHWLKASNFGFALTGDPQVTGIEFQVWCYGTGTSPIWRYARMVDELGTIQSSDFELRGLSNQQGVSGSEPQPFHLGGAYHHTGNNWTQTEINDVDFGYAIAVVGGSTAVVNVDAMYMRVWYFGEQSMAPSFSFDTAIIR